MGLYIKVPNDHFEPILNIFYLGTSETASNTNYNCFERTK